MFAPNAIPSAEAPVKSAAAARAPAMISSDAAEVGKAPPRLAFEPRR